MLDGWMECMRWLFAAFTLVATLLFLVGMVASIFHLVNWIIGRLLDWQAVIELAREAKQRDSRAWHHLVRANRWNRRV